MEVRERESEKKEREGGDGGGGKKGSRENWMDVGRLLLVVVVISTPKLHVYTKSCFANILKQ